MTSKIISFTSKIAPPILGKPFITRNRVSIIIKHPHEKLFLLIQDVYAITLPGGGVENDESIEEAARREAREETGYMNFDKFIDTNIIVDFYRNFEDENRLSKTFVVILHLADLVKEKGEMESMRVKKEDIYDKLGTDVSKLSWEAVLKSGVL